jgi:RNA polymerase sigma-70 factor (ECF subfamily)
MQFPQLLSEKPQDRTGASTPTRQRAPDDMSGSTDTSASLRSILDSANKEEQTRQLLRRFTDGDTDAFWSLWDLHNGHLYHLCLWQMAGVHEDAEEALSRAMLRALNKLPRNSHQIRNFKAWLSKLTFNLCVDLHRERTRQTRRLESIEDVWFGASDELVAATNSPEEAFLSQEVFTCLCEAVNDLPSRLREPFVLRFFQEMAYQDIAENLILSTENVRKRIQQARHILRERLSRVCPMGRPSTRTGRRTNTARKMPSESLPKL